MNSQMEKYESGWFLTILRMGAGLENKWFFDSPEHTEELTNSGFSLDNLESISPREARKLIRHSQTVISSDILNDNGLPLFTVFTHKNIGLPK